MKWNISEHKRGMKKREWTGNEINDIKKHQITINKYEKGEGKCI